MGVVALAATVLSLVVAVPANAGTLVATGQRCGLATLIYVRGSLEAAGSGSMYGGRVYQSGGIGQRLVNFGLAVDNDQLIPVYQEALNYPAAVWSADGTNYVNSVAIGVSRLRAEIEDIATTCPHTNILLAGYSQGAHVIGDVIDSTTSTQLSSNAKSKIAAVALWGDPTYVPGESWDAAGNPSARGRFWRNTHAFSQYVGTKWTENGPTSISRVVSYCLAGDAWCQAAYPGGQTIHESYNTTSGWAFMRQFLIDSDRHQ